MKQLQGKRAAQISEQAPVRIVHLSNYLSALIADVQAQGKIAKIDGNVVQVASVALLSGSMAVVETLWADLSVLAGNAKIQAKTVARPMAEMVVSRGVGMLFEKLLGK